MIYTENNNLQHNVIDKLYYFITGHTGQKTEPVLNYIAVGVSCIGSSGYQYPSSYSSP